MTIPVICDRCRVAGTAGTGDFSQFGDLLIFEPVPRRYRVNGWDAEAQRAFIALLATTGSKRQAAMAIGRNAYGVDQLLKSANGGSFKTAFDRAMAIAKQNGAMKIASGIADAAARNAQLGTPPSRLRGHEPDDEASEMPQDEKLGLLENIFLKLLRKVEAEREARLAGEVVAADFYLRQVTFIEVALDMMSEGLGFDAWSMLGELRRGGHGILQIAETPMSRTLDTQRRALWKVMADPDRPEYPPEDYLEHGADHSLEPLEYMRGGEDREREEQRDRYAAQHAEEAEAQAVWEASAQLVRGTSEHKARAHSPENQRTTRRPPDSVEYLSSLESEEDILAALKRDAESEDY
jgi:hypothetical protein